MGESNGESIRRQTDRQTALNCPSSQNESMSQTVSQQEKTEVSAESVDRAAEQLMLTTFFNRNRVDKVDVDVAKTLDAHLAKGPGTSVQTENGAIEWKRL